MQTAITYSPVTYEYDFNWYHHGHYEAYIKSLGSRGLGGRIKVLRVQFPYFPERLIAEINFFLENEVDPRVEIKNFSDDSVSYNSAITEGDWNGIAGTIINDDPLNKYVFVLGFPDGSKGLLRRLGRIVLKRSQHAWVKPTDSMGLYDPFGLYNARGKRVD